MSTACNHRKGPTSTLRTAVMNAAPGGCTLWWVRCEACGRYTEAYLTLGEAYARASLGWWAGKDDGE